MTRGEGNRRKVLRLLGWLHGPSGALPACGRQVREEDRGGKGGMATCRAGAVQNSAARGTGRLHTAGTACKVRGAVNLLKRGHCAPISPSTRSSLDGIMDWDSLVRCGFQEGVSHV